MHCQRYAIIVLGPTSSHSSATGICCGGDCFCSRLKYFQELCLFLPNNCNLSCSALALYICAVTTDVFQARLSRRCICILVSSAGAEWCLAYGVSPPLSQSVWFKRHSCCVEGEKNLSLLDVQAFIKKKISYWNVIIRCYRYTSEWAFPLPSAVLSHCGSMKNGEVFLIYEVLIFYSESISWSVFKCDRLQNEESYCLNCSLQGTMSLLISLHSYSMAAITMAFLLITVMWSKQKLLKGVFPCLWFPFILLEYSG